MRKELVIIVLVCIALLEAVPPKKKKPAAGGKQPLVGGFANADVNSADVQAAANFVLTEIKKETGCTGVTLIEVTKARQKVVAGTVFDLRLKFKTATNKMKKCKIMVTKDLPDTAAGTAGVHKMPVLAKGKKPAKKDCACANFLV